jgi:hypothetical protein
MACVGKFVLPIYKGDPMCNFFTTYSRKYILIFVFIFSPLPSACVATNLSIDCEKPCSSGSVIMSRMFDTIKFPNGVSLSFFDQTTLIPEPALLNHGLRVVSNRSNSKVGFKYLQSVNWITPSKSSTVKYYASSDTIWAVSNVFPGTLIQLDSLHNGDATKIPGKWLYYTDGDLSFGSWAGIIENSNNIFYIETNQNKMKLQVAKLFINQTIGIQTRMDSLRLLWDVDSLGNGKFTSSTGVKEIKKNACNNKSQLPFTKINPHYLKNNYSGGQLSLFDMQGKHTEQYCRCFYLQNNV